MLDLEKPGTVVITKMVKKNVAKSYNKSLNRRLGRSFGAYIRHRLAYKCRLKNINLVEISSKDTGNVCSQCGAEGIRKGYDFVCAECGFTADVGYNSARDIEIKWFNSVRTENE